MPVVHRAVGGDDEYDGRQSATMTDNRQTVDTLASGASNTTAVVVVA